jgi:hypothetical protein
MESDVTVGTGIELSRVLNSTVDGDPICTLLDADRLALYDTQDVRLTISTISIVVVTLLEVPSILKV